MQAPSVTRHTSRQPNSCHTFTSMYSSMARTALITIALIPKGHVAGVAYSVLNVPPEKEVTGVRSGDVGGQLHEGR
jgi:hypothetical protein